MSRKELIEKTNENLEMLNDNQLSEVYDFAGFLLSKADDKILSEQVSRLNISSKSYQFLEEDSDLYTVNDLKEKYGK